MKILVAYGTTEGHTREIADRVADWLRGHGYHPEVFNSARLRTIRPDEYDGFIILGSVHYGHHQRPLVQFVTANTGVLGHSPSAFISVCGAEAHAGGRGKAEAQRYIQQFTQETGWQPTAAVSIGGALLYSKYNLILRAVMKSISKRSGLPTDTSRDYDLTDWAVLEGFVKSFVADHINASRELSIAGR